MSIHAGILRRPWRLVSAMALASMLALVANPLASAQEASPSAGGGEMQVSVMDVDGNELGVLSFVQVDGADVVRITGELDGLEPGEHGFHIHGTGICDASGDEPFSSAGGHFNPADAMHGPGPEHVATPTLASPMAMPDTHAGDLGNITADDDGVALVDIASDRFSLAPGDSASLDDVDGSAIVVHQGADDFTSQPSGDSGPRIGCGVIFAGSGATPKAVDAHD